MKQTSLLRWQIGEGDNKEFGVTQLLMGGEKPEIPGIKLSLFINDKEGNNYEGHSLLRAAYKHWYIKDTLYQIDAIAHEKHGLGVLKVKVPKEAKTDDRNTAKEIAREQRANEEAYIEELEGFEFEFMDMQSGTLRDIMPSVQHHDRMILQSVLAQFLSIGSSDSGGSFAASDNQTELFIMAEEAAAKMVQSVFNNTVIANICELNGVAPENRPKLDYGRIGKDSVQVFSEALNKLFVSGAITPGPEVEDYIRNFLHLPQLDQETIDNYDAVRAVRTNPARTVSPAANPPATPPSTTGNDGFTKKEADEMIRQARQMREQLAAAATGGKHGKRASHSKSA